MVYLHSMHPVDMLPHGVRSTCINVPLYFHFSRLFFSSNDRDKTRTVFIVFANALEIRYCHQFLLAIIIDDTLILIL